MGKKNIEDFFRCQNIEHCIGAETLTSDRSDSHFVVLKAEYIYKNLINNLIVEIGISKKSLL